MGAAAALIVMMRQQKLVDRFISAGAITADKAKPLNDIGVQPGLMFRKLAAGGVFHSVSNDRWYFDAAGFRNYRDRQWKRLAIAALLIFAIAAIGLAFAMIL